VSGVPGVAIRLVVVDDHEIVRHGLRLSLELEPDMVVAGEASTGAEAVEVALDVQPDVLLLDVRLGDIDGPEVCRRVLAVAPRISIVMLTNYLQDDLVFRSLVAGAKGYVIKDVQLGELKKMIRAVHRGNAVLDPKVTTQVISTATGRGMRAPARRAASPSPGAALTDTTLGVVRCLAQGLTNREIGERVHLSPHTVKDHIQKLCDAFGVRSRAAVVAEAARRGLI
jgi:two-component system NarL family response regulator